MVENQCERRGHLSADSRKQLKQNGFADINRVKIYVAMEDA